MGLFLDIKKKFENFSLSVHLQTEVPITGLLGASGCGKSMTLRCIAGIEKPDEGKIILNGRTLFDSEHHINLPPQERNVGYLFQNYALFPNMTVAQNILTGLSKEKSKAKKKEILSEMLELFSLTDLARRKPHELSGGQAQRVALARILASRPQLLLLDEPFSALDTYLREQLQVQMLETLKTFGKDTILVTHSRDEAYHMCGQVALMDKGRIFSFGAMKSVFANPKTIAGARITGCKNIAKAKKTGEKEIFVPEWGISLSVSHPVEDSLEAVGIRAHAFLPALPEIVSASATSISSTLNASNTSNVTGTINITTTTGAPSSFHSFPVVFSGELEEPFEWILQFRFSHQASDSLPLWWRIPKEQYPKNLPKCLYLSSDDILLLYPQDANDMVKA